jgi:ABC-type multidrug transport system permease subunit
MISGFLLGWFCRFALVDSIVWWSYFHDLFLLISGTCWYQGSTSNFMHNFLVCVEVYLSAHSTTCFMYCSFANIVLADLLVLLLLFYHLYKRNLQLIPKIKHVCIVYIFAATLLLQWQQKLYYFPWRIFCTFTIVLCYCYYSFLG